jgi:hypothetical protein
MEPSEGGADDASVSRTRSVESQKSTVVDRKSIEVVRKSSEQERPKDVQVGECYVCVCIYIHVYM